MFGDVVDADNLGGLVCHGEASDGDRTDRSLIAWPIDNSADEAFARHAQADRSAKSLEFAQFAQQLQTVFVGFAEADAGIEND